MGWEDRFRRKRLIPATDIQPDEPPDPPWRPRAKASLNERNWREAIKRFSGDPKLAAQYLPVAQTLLGGLVHQLRLGGIEYGHRIVNLPEGARIRVIHNSGINVVEIDVQTFIDARRNRLGIYLESGFVDAKIYGPKDSFQPKNRLFDTVFTQQAESFVDALNFDNLFTPIRFDNKSHAIPGGYEDKRHVFPMTLMATGLLRKALQAKLGRADPNYQVPAMGEENEGAQSKINETTKEQIAKLLAGKYGEMADTYLRRVSIGGSGKYKSYGLHRTSDYRYYLISLQSSGTPDLISVIGYPCSITAVGEEIRRIILRKTKPLKAEDKERLEAYLLSTIAPDFEVEIILGTAEVQGQELFHGWHFNNTGSATDMVTLETIFMPEPEDWKAKHIKARHYRIKLNENPGYNPQVAVSQENPPLTVLSESLEVSIGTPIMNGDNLWTPFYQRELMKCHYWRPHYQPFAEDLVFDMPVYCFYNSDDKLVLVRVSGSPKDVGDDFYFYTRLSRAAWACLGGEGASQGEYLNTTNTHGFYITVDGDLLSDYRREEGTGKKGAFSVTSALTGQRTSRSSPSNGYTGPGFTPCEEVDFSQYRDSDLGRYSETIYEYRVDGLEYFGQISRGIEGLCIIPYYDAESVYMGVATLEEENGPEIKRTAYGIGRQTATWPDAGVSLEVNAFARPDAAVAQGGGLTHPAPQSDLRMHYNYKIVAELYLHYRHGYFKTADHAAEINQESDRDSLWLVLNQGWWQLINPIFFGSNPYPYYNYPIIVTQGLLDNVVYFKNPKFDNYNENFAHKNLEMTDEEFYAINYGGLFCGWT